MSGGGYKLSWLEHLAILGAVLCAVLFSAGVVGLMFWAVSKIF